MLKNIINFDSDILGILAIIVGIIIVIIIFGVWIWILWMISAALLASIGYAGEYEFWLRVFIVIMISTVLGALGRIGLK